MRPPTPSQQRILDYLASNPGRLVNCFELRDECCPTAGDGVIRVQIHFLRQRCNAGIVSKTGPRGGYRLAAQ